MKEDRTRYSVSLEKKEKGKISLHLRIKFLPLIDRGYGNYEELNIVLTKLRKNVEIEAYFLRDSWNGSGRYDVCWERTRVPDLPFSREAIEALNNTMGVKGVIGDVMSRIRDHVEDCEKIVMYWDELVVG